MLPPDTTPLEIPRPRLCADCDQQLGQDRKWRCRRCQAAALWAIRKHPGQVITPSMVRACRAPF